MFGCSEGSGKLDLAGTRNLGPAMCQICHLNPPNEYSNKFWDSELTANPACYCFSRPRSRSILVTKLTCWERSRGKANTLQYLCLDRLSVIVWEHLDRSDFLTWAQVGVRRLVTQKRWARKWWLVHLRMQNNIEQPSSKLNWSFGWASRNGSSSSRILGLPNKKSRLQ